MEYHIANITAIAKRVDNVWGDLEVLTRRTKERSCSSSTNQNSINIQLLLQVGCIVDCRNHHPGGVRNCVIDNQIIIPKPKEQGC